MAHLSKKIYSQLIDHAKAGYPNEACGLLGGPSATSASADADHNLVSVFFPMRNVDEASISYFMDPKEQLQVFKKMRELGVELRGIFHSHVASEAFPSQKDVRLAFYPDVSYLIVSLSDMNTPVLRSFKIHKEHVKEEEVKIA